MRNNAIILRRMLGYTKDQQLLASMSPHDTLRSIVLTNILATYVRYIVL